jgi:hypothetical protein
MSIGNKLKTTDNLNIRIHRDIEGKRWLGWGRIEHPFPIPITI